MRIFVAILAGGTSLPLVTAAHADPVRDLAGAPDPGPSAGERIVLDFNNIDTDGYRFVDGSLGIARYSRQEHHARPASIKGNYGYVSTELPHSWATLATPNERAISFYWGSIDAYNFVDVFGRDGALLFTVDGNFVSRRANGNWWSPTTNRRVYLDAGPGNIITAVRFRTTDIAFEFGGIAASASIPEPATWAMLIVGFGLVGASARCRRGEAKRAV